MVVLNFDENWSFSRLGEGRFERVTLPHDAMLGEKRTRESRGGVHSGWYEGHDYEYRKAFTLPEELREQRIWFEFEGVYRNTEVYLNGTRIAFRPYGFTNFYADAQPAIDRTGKNELRVIARNADQPNCRWYPGAGIYRPVKLIALPERHLELNGVRVRTVDYRSREIEVTLRGPEGEAELSVSDGGCVLATLAAKVGTPVRFRVPEAELWSTENPKLYRLTVRYGEDAREITFGIREVQCGAEAGFTLNGERVILRGACVHTDNGLLGAAAHPFADARKVALLKDAGYNAIRSAHNPCSKATLDACDRLGMLVLDEYTDGWFIRKTRFDYADCIESWWKQDLTDMVEKDANHPSVVMYSIGNEVSETATKRGIAFCREMTEYLHALDDRPVTCGINLFFNYLSSLGFGVYSDKKAEKDRQVGSAFFNKLAGIFGDKTMKIGATLGGSDRKTREAYAALDVAGYNYGILRYRKDLKKYPRRVILGSETFCKDTYRFYELAKSCPAIIGDFVWAGMDYLGEVGIGSWEYRDYAEDFSPVAGWISAGSGRLDLTGKPNAEMAYTRVAYGLDAVRLAAIPPHRCSAPHSPSAWKMTNAIESWSWPGCEGKKTRVEVYARADRAELRLNGARVARKRVKDGVARFRVRYAPGTLAAVALDKAGREIARAEIVSAGAETKLALVPERARVGQGDLIYVRLKYADANGVTQPLARGRIRVKAENAKLLGLGHACPYNPDGYGKDATDTYYGEALAILAPKGAGSVRVLAESPYGNAEAEVIVE